MMLPSLSRSNAAKGVAALGAVVLVSIGLHQYGLGPEEMESEATRSMSDSALEELVDPLAEELAKDLSRRMLREYRSSKGLFSCDETCENKKNMWLESERELLTVQQQRAAAKRAERLRLRLEKSSSGGGGGSAISAAKARQDARIAARRAKAGVGSTGGTSPRAAAFARAAARKAARLAAANANRPPPPPTPPPPTPPAPPPPPTPPPTDEPMSLIARIVADREAAGIKMREARVFNRQNPGFYAEKYITITGNYHQGCPAGYDAPLEDCWMAAFEFTGLLHNPEPKIHQGGDGGFTDYTTNYGTYGKGSPCGCYVGRDRDPLVLYGQGTCVQEGGGLSRERLTFVCKKGGETWEDKKELEFPPTGKYQAFVGADDVWGTNKVFKCPEGLELPKEECLLAGLEMNNYYLKDMGLYSHGENTWHPCGCSVNTFMGQAFYEPLCLNERSGKDELVICYKEPPL